MNDLYVVCPYREIQFMGLVQYSLAESFIGLSLAVRTMRNFCHVTLQLKVPGINRGK